jgi:hypothetical protein
MLPRNIVEAMAATADQAIGKALLVGSQAMSAPPRTEVGFVAAVTLGAIGDIATAWKPLCSTLGFRLELHSVFCHAVPIIRFNDGKGRAKRCELADVLVVIDITTGGTLLRRAALIQAKMARAAARVSVTGKSSVVQLDLYQNWYRFDFEDPALNMQHVNFNAGTGAAYSGTFGVIDRHLIDRARDPPVWTQHTARPTPEVVTASNPRIGKFMAEMVDGTKRGFGRLATPSMQTDWSKAVERLLKVTYEHVFTHKATLGGVRPRRGVSAVACLSFKSTADLARGIWGQAGGHPPFDDIPILEFDDPPAGISLVHVELRDERLPP